MAELWWIPVVLFLLAMAAATSFATSVPAELGAAMDRIADPGTDSPDVFDPSVLQGGFMVIPISQIASVAAAAGFAGADLVTAVAIALAESGGNSAAYNPETAAGTPPGQGSYGLWQIYRKAHPEFSDWDLTDPQTNANAAFSVYSAAGSSFRPWSTFKNGAYVARLQSAQVAVNA